MCRGRARGSKAEGLRHHHNVTKRVAVNNEEKYPRRLIRANRAKPFLTNRCLRRLWPPSTRQKKKRSSGYRTTSKKGTPIAATTDETHASNSPLP
eukprot:3741217-Prymnesium_polylepis.1